MEFITKTQIEFTYNSNHIEGSALTRDQTRYIFETNYINISDKAVGVDDILETANHFRCFDFIIDNVNKPRSEKMIKKLHFMLKNRTNDDKYSYFKVGEYKVTPNEVGGKETVDSKNVKKEMKKLLETYNKI